MSSSSSVGAPPSAANDSSPYETSPLLSSRNKPLKAVGDSREAQHGGGGDLEPTQLDESNWWEWIDFARMWVSILVNPSGYILGAALLHLGLSWLQAVGAVLCGSCLLVGALVLNAWAGAQYGIPFPVLARCAFGIEGAKVVAGEQNGRPTQLTNAPRPTDKNTPRRPFWTVLRGVIAIYYISINMWIGAEAIVKGYEAVLHTDHSGGSNASVADGSAAGGGGSHDDAAEVSAGQLVSFAGFVLVHILVFCGDGIRSMRVLAKWLMPVQLVGLLAILSWGLTAVPFHALLNATRVTLQEDQVTSPVGGQRSTAWVFLQAVTTVVSSWSTMSLNIADISRFAKNQRAQVVGQLVGFVLPNVAVATTGILTTGAAAALHPDKAGTYWNFVNLFDLWPPAVAALGALFLALSILSHNLAANVVSPANDFANLLPRWISFRRGAYFSICVASCLMPWRILASPNGYIQSFVMGYSTV
jgi:NCS1 family nucleobase:cation symporter-1